MARSYRQQIIARLQDPSDWPNFPASDFLGRLDAIAARGAAQRGPHGHLAAVLIYHQLVEQMMLLLIADTRFFLQLTVFPLRLEYSAKRRRTFGQILAELEDTFEFPNKASFLKCAKQINELRNGFAHALSTRGSLAGLARDARKAHSLEERAFHYFDVAHDWFRASFNGFRKDWM